MFDSPKETASLAGIDTSFQTAIDQGKINGAIFLASNAKGDFTYTNTIGERTLLSGEKQPLQADNVIYLASGTKIIAAIAALQCVEDGLIALDTDVSSIAPELANKQIITGWSEETDTPILEPATRPITFEMLLKHTSGMSYHFFNPLLLKWCKKYDQLEEGQTRPVEEAFAYPLTYQPGAGWMYSPGLDWAGRIVERLTGKTLGQFAQERIFDPLGINSAQFHPVTREDLRARMVDLNPNDPNGVGIAVVGSGESNKRSRGDFGGHGLFIGASDYAKVIHAVLVNDGKLFKPETGELMVQDRLTPEEAAGHQAALAGPIGPFFRVGTEKKAGYGLSGHVNLEDEDGWYGDHTLSWGGGMTLAWFADRKNDLTGVVAVQATIPTDVPVVTELKQVFRKDIYRKYAAWKQRRGS
ncbi:unnamed protein product [Clonostachys rhizophaga]|uniref:Beta-lactamase-related domain-containing protein n=1 Tax=Clonostachys rhizophaga TaxID=160324 RepID=A0A9N9YNM8_9HYPO|nr:unnamed protein product [Clonostachys rhizophaga]